MFHQLACANRLKINNFPLILHRKKFITMYNYSKGA